MYAHFYGFSQKPFPVTSDPKFLFLTDNHQKVLEAIRYAISERKGLVSVSGEAGTGKTTILHHVLDTLDKNIKTVFITQPQITPKQLLQEIARKLGLPFPEESKTSLLRRLKECLLAALPEQGNLAILIDEAQHLSPEVLEELRMLSNLEACTPKLIQIVLAGQPELEENLNSQELLKQQIAIRSQIRPLTAEESSRYIDHRLRLVGKSAGEVFSPEAMALIGRHAEGIPRVINLLCDNALLIGYRRKEKRIPATTVKEVLSDRAMMSEEKGPKPSRAESASSPGKVKVRRTYAAAAYWGIPAALVLILIFLGGGGHFGLLSEKISLIVAKKEAAAVPKESSLPMTPPERIRETPSGPAFSEERGAAGIGDLKSSGEAPDPSPVSPKMAESKICTAEEGETLYSILRKHYGRANSSLLDYLLAANPEISDPHVLIPGCRIRIPALAEESLIRRSPGGDFQVHLATLAVKEAAENAGKERTLQGKVIHIESFGISSRETWYRLFAGGYKNREEALEAAKAFRGKGLLAVFPPIS